MFSDFLRRAMPPARRYRAFALTALPLFCSLLMQTAVQAQTGTLSFNTTNQQIEGIGFSDAFGEANALKQLPAAQQTTILNLLYSQQTGAGFSLLRLGIGTDSQIEPTSPGSPTATPTYVFDGSDGGQVYLAQSGQHYGLNDFFADSWSAPGFMKNNNSIDNGGYICGTVDAPVGSTGCTGDWRQAYANYLVQYVNFYKAIDIPITALGWINEPDYNVTYNSMQATTAGALDFVDNAFGPVVRASGLPLRTMCCDGSKWPISTPFTQAIMADPVATSYIDIISSHEYGGHATSAQPTTKPVWMTEWSSTNGTFEPRWDCSGCSGGPDGMYLAGDIIQAFVSGNVNEYNYWWGTSTGAAALILTTPSTSTYTVAGRFYALAAISRFVRPGAYRVTSTNSNTNLAVVGFLNTDGSKVVALLNNATTAVTANYTVDSGTSGSNVKTYLTDTNDAVNETDTAALAGTNLSMTLPARSLTTVVIAPTVVSGSPQLLLTPTLTKLGDGSFQAALKVTNVGPGTAQGVTMTAATLGSATGVPAPGTALPQSVGLGNLAPGGYTIMPMNFAAAAGTSGSSTVQRYTGTYSSGTFGGSFRTILP